MGKKDGVWREWGSRLRAHVREHKELSWAKIARELDQSEGGIRHWCNGTREVNLSDFFRLCGAAKADPQEILFGEEAAIVEKLRTFLEDNPRLFGVETGSIVAYKPGQAQRQKRR